MSALRERTGVSVVTDCADIVSLDEISSRKVALKNANQCLAGKSSEERVDWALRTLPQSYILSSSFGAQSAVALHLLTQQAPDIPVVFIDTGYHFPETYRFTDDLCERLNLNLKVFRPTTSSAWQEARNGERWTQGLAGINAYNKENKVAPMQQALVDLNVGTWFAGLRSAQSASRKSRQFVEQQGNVWKVHPILDWTDKDVFNYLQANNLPYHPLWDKGYVSIGDVHTTKPLHEVESEEQTRFFGLKRECGLHEIVPESDSTQAE